MSKWSLWKIQSKDYIYFCSGCGYVPPGSRIIAEIQQHCLVFTVVIIVGFTNLLFIIQVGTQESLRASCRVTRKTCNV